MLLKQSFAAVLVLLAVLSYSPSVHGQISLGTARSFAVLGGSTVSNVGMSSVSGDVGVFPGSSVIGFQPGVVTGGGTIHAGNAVASQAQADLSTAYNAAAATPCGVDLTGQNLGGLTLTPGVYCFAGSAQLTGTLSLNFQGNPNAFFLFKVASGLSTSPSSSVQLVNAGGSTCPPNVFWQVGTSATLSVGTTFVGNILALSGITLNTNARLSGRALTRNGAVTLDTTTVEACARLLNGDANGDGIISVGDVFYLINHLFSGGPAPIGPGDANSDGAITVGDVFYLINFLFAGGPAPV